ncbi:MAG: homoserine dehydrogenase [Chloroflexi bacterium]|nr:homoserine dehydrogenase [Chloroflexota bacterium]
MGLGVVGGGVAATLLDRSETIRGKIGRPVKLKKVLVRDLAKTRNSALPPSLLTTDPEEILSDPDIHVLVEVIGGTKPAAGYLKAGLSAGKHVVTANKEVMAKHGPELLSLARRNRVNLLFEASVCGGIPIVGCLMNELVANDVCSVRGIINGTTNYILTRMAHHGTDFGQALKEAQERGYAEADPTNDVEGIDAVYKLAILASLAFHLPFNPEDVYRQGISSLEQQDFRYAQELGYAIKSLAIATLEDGAIQARVHPALVPLGHMLAKVDGVYNAVEVEGSLCGKVLFHGMGAGREPTTSAVVGDVIEVARRMTLLPGQPANGSPQADEEAPLAAVPPGGEGEAWSVESIDGLMRKYYLRLRVADQPGVLAQIARLLGDGEISLASVLQKDTNPADQTAEIVITTHPAREASVQEALRSMANLEVVRGVNNLLRIEE